MSKKFKLFASVAVPIVSLPLMMQPAAATPPKLSVAPSGRPDVIQVQEQLIVPPGAEQDEGEGEQRPRRKQREEAPDQPSRAERRDQGEAEGGERPRRQSREEAAPEEPSRAEGRGQGETEEGQRPRRQSRETQSDDAAPRQAERPAEEELKRPDRRATEQESEQPSGERPRRQSRETQADDAAPAPSQAERPAEDNSREQRQRAGQDSEQPTGGERPRRQSRETQSDDAAPGQAERPTDELRTPDSRQATEPEQNNRQRRQQAGQDSDQQNDRDRPPVPGQDSASPDTGTQTQTPAAEAPATGAPAQTPDQQAGEPPRQPDATAAGEQVQPPRTPEQVERAKELARDPASAREGEQVVLPVENGAAILDSAKEPSARPTRDGERPRRQRPAETAAPTEPPKSDAEAQAGGERGAERVEIRRAREEEGERLDRRPEFERPRGWEFRDIVQGEGRRDRDRRRDRDDDNGRVIISIDNQTFVRHDDSRRFYRDGQEPEYERLRGGRVREVIDRGDGVQIVTIRNRYGEIVQRSRFVNDEEYVLYYAPDRMEDDRDYVWRDPGDDLPPMRLTVPVEDYIIDTSSEPDRDYYEFLEQPPVERVERVYSLDEVRYSARLRDKVRRIDLDTITFATGSAEIPMNQAGSLRQVADAINRILEKNPGETFLIEGHTDAVGSDESNLVLSDERAESVATVLTDAFSIPPENLATQGYGERYLKVVTDGPEQENRRVTIRRITPLVKPVASKQ